MNTQNTLNLIESFPRIFEIQKKISETSLHLIHCGDGWYDLLKEFCISLDGLAKNEGRSLEAWPTIASIEQKYGTLRIDLNNPSSAMIELTIAAEKQSAEICELCGNPGRIHEEDWVICRCDDCLNPGRS